MRSKADHCSTRQNWFKWITHWYSRWLFLWWHYGTKAYLFSFMLGYCTYSTAYLLPVTLLYPVGRGGERDTSLWRQWVVRLGLIWPSIALCQASQAEEVVVNSCHKWKGLQSRFAPHSFMESHNDHVSCPSLWDQREGARAGWALLQEREGWREGGRKSDRKVWERLNPAALRHSDKLGWFPLSHGNGERLNFRCHPALHDFSIMEKTTGVLGKQPHSPRAAIHTRCASVYMEYLGTPLFTVISSSN